MDQANFLQLIGMDQVLVSMKQPIHLRIYMQTIQQITMVQRAMRVVQH